VVIDILLFKNLWSKITSDWILYCIICVSESKYSSYIYCVQLSHHVIATTLRLHYNYSVIVRVHHKVSVKLLFILFWYENTQIPSNKIVSLMCEYNILRNKMSATTKFLWLLCFSHGNNFLHKGTGKSFDLQRLQNEICRQLKYQLLPVG